MKTQEAKAGAKTSAGAAKAASLTFEDVTVGQSLPERRLGPITVAHIMRWSSASENWHRIHYDYNFATRHEGLPDVMINGSWKQNVLIQMLVDWVGETGWLWTIDFQFRAMNIPGEILRPWGRVTEKAEWGPFGTVGVALGLLNDAEVESTPGTALLVLPRRGGPAVPYPFDPTEYPGLPAPPPEVLAR